MIKTFITVLLFGVAALAQVPPPVSIKGQDSAIKLLPKWNLQVPNQQVTNMGGIDALIETGNTNVLANPEFEASTVSTGWTISGGAATADTTTMFSGKKAIVLPNAVAAGDLLVQNYADCSKFAGQNLEASIYLKNANTLSQVQVCSLSQGTEVQCVPASQSGAWVKHTLNMAAPATGSCGIKVKNTAGLSVSPSADMAYVGLATNLSSVSQASFYGGAQQTGATNCSYTQNTSAAENAYVDLGTAPSCASAWASFGNCTAVGPTSSQITCANMPPGDYMFQISAAFNVSGSGMIANFKMSDSTNTFGFTTIFSSGVGASTAGQALGRMTYTTPGTRTFKVVSAASGAATTGIVNNTAGREFVWRIWRFPTSSELAIRPSVPTQPTMTLLTSGSGNYVPPSGAKYLRIRMVGGGGGASGAGTGSTAGIGGNGGITVFGTSLLSASGGQGSGNSGANNVAGTPGSGSIAAPAYGTALIGGYGSANSNPAGSAGVPGGLGGAGAVFGVPTGSRYNGSGIAANANTGSGGSGGSANTAAVNPGIGGSGGGGVEAIVPGPLASSYAYQVGIAGSAGNAGSSGSGGGAGAAGQIEITEYYGTENTPLLIGSVTYSDTVMAGGPNGANTVAVGSYTPTLVNVANSTGLSATGPFSWTRIADTVIVSGAANSGCTTAGGTLTDINMTLPVATANFTAVTDAAGGGGAGVSNEANAVFANVGATTARLRFFCQTTTAGQNRFFTFQYKIK